LTAVTKGMAMADYLRLPAVSAGILIELLDRCPAAAKFASWLNPNPPLPDDSDGSDKGQVAHEILLEGAETCVCIIDPIDHPAEKTGNIPDGWTNKSIRAARDVARAAGLIPILLKDMASIRAMVDAAKDYIACLKETEPAVWAAFQRDGGDSELTCVWNDDGTNCRIRPDRISADRKLVVHVKTSKGSVEPDAWGRTHLYNESQYVRAAFYRRGCKAVFNTDADQVFLCIEQEPPHLCSLVGIPPPAIELADAKVETALRKWHTCVQASRWVGYPTRVAYPDLPAYVQAAWEQKEAIDYGSQP
jgi:hypothetical protein